jgi:hypothetical protein
VIKLLVTVTALCSLATAIRAQAPQVPASSVASRAITAISYEVGGGSTMVHVNSTGSMAQAKVEAKAGLTIVEAQVQGDVLFDNSGRGKLKVTTQLQTFSLFVSAELYSAIRQAGEVLILENALRKNAKGKVIVVNNYPLIRRNQYAKLGNPLGFSVDLKNTPPAKHEACNAVDIARRQTFLPWLKAG